MNRSALPRPDQRFLFQVEVTAQGRLIYAVGGDNEEEALATLKAGDLKDISLIYDELKITTANDPTYLGLGLEKLKGGLNV